MASLVCKCCLQMKLNMINTQPTRLLYVASAVYAKKIGGGKMSAQPMPRVELEVETDPDKLVKFCCGANMYIGGKDPELKLDSEYPEWLWTLRTNPKPPDLSELDPDTYQYWRRLRKLDRRQKNQLKKTNRIK